MANIVVLQFDTWFLLWLPHTNVLAQDHITPCRNIERVVDGVVCCLQLPMNTCEQRYQSMYDHSLYSFPSPRVTLLKPAVVCGVLLTFIAGCVEDSGIHTEQDEATGLIIESSTEFSVESDLGMDVFLANQSSSTASESQPGDLVEQEADATDGENKESEETDVILVNQAGAVPVEAQSGAVAEPVLVSVESEVDEPEEVMVAELESGAGEAVMPEEEEPAIEPEVVVATEEPAVVITSVEVEEPEIAAASGPDLEAVEGWPTQSNDSLPLGGVFYGTFKGGMMSGNGPIAMENAIRFRAERTGFVKAVRYNNRRLLPTDIGHRCDLYGEGSVWCNCKEAGLDNISCGYTLANSYHVGSGGLITIELRNDDSSSRHLPGKTVLASTNAYVPVEVNNKFPTIALRQPVQVQAGKIYHLVFRNDKPPVGCGLKNLTLAEAAACPRDQGAIGLNGTKHGTDPSPSGRFGPFLGKTGTGLHFKTTANGPWILRKDVIAFYELQYTDGEYIGDTYAGYDNPNYGASKGTQIIEGSTLGRQLFTVEDLTREVNGLWLQYGHVYDRRVNGRPLTVRLKDSAGTVLATGQIPASRECNEIALAAAKDGKARGTRDDWMCRTWAYSDLSTPVSLLEGAEYSVEFSAPAGAGYALSTFFSVHRRDERNMWENARAQISTNNGVNWADWTGSYFASRDLPVLFTIVGMPKHLP